MTLTQYGPEAEFAAAGLPRPEVEAGHVVVQVKATSVNTIDTMIPMLNDFRREAHGKILSTLAGLVDAGAVKPLLDDQRFTLTQVGEAYARLKSGQAIGKVVVDV